MTRVLLAAPVRGRGWILPAYLEWLAALRIPEDVSLDAYFLVNGEDDGGAAMLERFAEVVAPRMAVTVERWAEETAVPPSRETANRRNLFGYLARLRNATLDRALAGGYDHLFSVDSDILLPPDALARLLGHGRDVVAATLCNDEFWQMPARYRNYNLLVRAPYPGPDGGEGYHHAEDLPANGLVEVEVTGACMLVSRAVLEAGCRFADHSMGEDVPFCQQARANGFRLYGDSGLRVDHLMAQHTWIAPRVLAGLPQPLPSFIHLHSGDRPRVEVVYNPQASQAALGRVWARLLAQDAFEFRQAGLPADLQVAGFRWDHAAGVMRLQLIGAEPEPERAVPPAPRRAKAPRRGVVAKGRR